MNPRERVLSAFERRGYDRIPVEHEAHYRRRSRCIPKELLSSEVREHVVDPFN